MTDALLVIAMLAAALVLLPFAHLAAWSLVPPRDPRSLATGGQFAVVDGIETYWECHGEGPPVLLIPPGGGQVSTWRMTIAALARTHRVWSLDLPGSGLSAKPADFAYTHAAYARFVRSFMAKMGLSRAAIGGHSLGGTVALALALDAPEVCAGLILIAAGGYPREGRIGRFNPLRSRLANAALMSFAAYPWVIRRAFRLVYHAPSRFAADRDLVARTSALLRVPGAQAAYFRMQKGLDFGFALPEPARIRTVAVPTLVVWGQDDRVIPPATAARFARDIAGAAVLIVPEAGHMVHEEQPDAVNRAIVDFLAAIGW